MSTFDLVTCIAFTVIAVIAARRGEAPWSHVVVWGLALQIAFLMAIGWEPTLDEVEITAWGIRRTFGGKLRRKVEAVAWPDIIRLEVETTATGPMAEDMFFIIHGSNGKGVVVAGAQASRHGLVAQLQARFPGLDNLALAVASGCTEQRYFHLWPANDRPVAED